jgi:TetR/AcrR family transcriptional repressor of mexJK operon
VIDRKCQQFLPRNLEKDFLNFAPEKCIQEFSKSFMQLIMSEEAIRIYRMIMGEASHQPDMVRMFYDAGPKPVQKMLDLLMSEYIRHMKLKNKTPHDLRCHLLSLLQGSEQYLHRCLNIGSVPSKTDINKVALKQANLFLKSYK